MSTDTPPDGDDPQTDQPVPADADRPTVSPDHPGHDVAADPEGGDLFHVDVTDDVVREWYHPEDGDRYVAFREIEDYMPSVYISTRGDDGVMLDDLADELREDPRTVAVEREAWFLRLDARERSPVLRVDLDRPSEIRSFATSVRHDYERGDHPPGTFRLYNADFTPGFQYCLERERDPTPPADVRTFRVQITEKAIADRDVSELRVAGDRVRGSEDAVLESLAARLRDVDPDVLVLSTADLVPLLHGKADEHGVDLQLGRLPGHRQLAGENAVESYGQVGHSPARYHVPGRAIVDTSNSFLLGHSSVGGLTFLVHRSRRPLQETAWGSIGTILTSIQTRTALDRGVLVPLQKRQRETYKDVRTLHEGDRGGFTFEPRVGLHEDVVELDFASLYPRIIREYNVSPETVGCTCDEYEHTTVPRLEYSICRRDGFLGDVLTPLLYRRQLAKQRLAASGVDAVGYNDEDAGDPVSDEEAISNAIKWILVSCFGYQGYRNAKFGRIECHEAINAYARDILLTAEAALQDAGWEVVHGIVDSLWVSARAEPDSAADSSGHRPRGRTAPEPIREVADRISEAVGIDLEFEAEYDWVTFHPRTGASGGALNRYVGKKSAGGFKYRGVECRQRSTPDFVGDAQEAFVRSLDEHREPGAVCDVLAGRIAELERGDVAPGDLVIRQRVSKPLHEYSRRTHNVAALERSKRLGVPKHPGQDVTFVVIDVDASKRGAVELAFEDPQDYSVEYYERLLVRACRSIVSPLGWDEDRIRRYLQADRDATLDRWT